MGRGSTSIGSYKGFHSAALAEDRSPISIPHQFKALPGNRFAKYFRPPGERCNWLILPPQAKPHRIANFLRNPAAALARMPTWIGKLFQRNAAPSRTPDIDELGGYCGEYVDTHHFTSRLLQLPITSALEICCQLLLHSTDLRTVRKIEDYLTQWHPACAFILGGYYNHNNRQYLWCSTDQPEGQNLLAIPEDVQIINLKLMVIRRLVNAQKKRKQSVFREIDLSTYIKHFSQSTPRVRFELAKSLHKIFQQGDKDDPKTQALKAKAIALLKNREVLLSEHAIEAGELLDELVGRHWVQDYIEDSYRN